MRDQDAIRCVWICNESWNDGKAHEISSMVFWTLEDLCYCKPCAKLNYQEIELIKPLGAGSSGTVYEGKIDDSAVVKFHRTQEKLEREKKALTVLNKGKVENIPKLLGTDNENQALIMLPVAKIFVPMSEPNGEKLLTCMPY